MIIRKTISSDQKHEIAIPEEKQVDIILEIEKGETEVKIRSDNRMPQSVSLNVIHRKPNTGSRVTFNSIVRSRLRIDAKLTMERDSGGSRGSISMNAIKIGKNAEAELSPKLVILNSNVQAEHKSSAQGIPKEVVSYLMSRGIGKKESERLFCSCFLNQ